MENRRSDAHPGWRAGSLLPLFSFLFSIVCLSALGGCGAPGEPAARKPLIPAAVTDLAAQQQGQSVVVTFTLPRDTVDGKQLNEPPQLEIFRAFFPPGTPAVASAATTAPVYTIPGSLLDTYEFEGRVRFVDPMRPDELARHDGEQVAYVVRTNASRGHDSADSNLAVTTVYPPPPVVTGLGATVTQDAIELHWKPPEQPSRQAPSSAAVNYHVYRARVAAGAGADAARNPAAAKLQSPAVLTGVAASPSYRDGQFDFGQTYVYTVRSVAEYPSGAVESADSERIVVTPRDTFPPSPPKNLSVVLVPGANGALLHLELSWDINAEPDLAGYSVYRSEQPNARGQKLNLQVLPTPTFRDISVVAGRRYYYSVTAVDRAGNESLSSAAVSVVIPK